MIILNKIEEELSKIYVEILQNVENESDKTKSVFDIIIKKARLNQYKYTADQFVHGTIWGRVINYLLESEQIIQINKKPYYALNINQLFWNCKYYE